MMKDIDRKPELLAPAGDLEKLSYALAYGADAVYAGGPKWGLRAQAGNFSADELRRGVGLVHRQGKKIYVTVNIFAHDEDFVGLAEYLLMLADLKVDGLVVADPGIMCLAQQTVPHVPLHLSTQMNSTNRFSVDFWLDQGIRRVIAARELSRDELLRMCRHVGDKGEVEIFVHGAMCMAYSGRCFLSLHLTGRDANRGACTQSCRWRYHIVEEMRPGDHMSVDADERGSAFFSAQDLCLLPFIPELVQLGLACWKIEGRMKGLHYVARTVKTYREALDVFWERGEEAFRRGLAGWLCELDKVSHRPYAADFFLNEKITDKTHTVAPSGDHIFIGRALSREECASLRGEGAWIEQRNHFACGDVIEVLYPNRPAQRLVIEEMWDRDGNALAVARHAKMWVRLPWPELDEFALLTRCRS